MTDKYWKKDSRLWPLLTIAGFLAALICSFVIPSAQEKVFQTPYRIVLAVLTVIFLSRYVIGFFNEKMRVRVNHQAQLYAAVSMLILLWDLLTTKTNTLLLPFFPGPAQILQVMAEDYKTLVISTFYSMRLLVFGFALGTILGVIPATAWIPIAMICFPSSFMAEIFLIILSVWFPVAYMTSSGIANTPKSYFEAARTLGGGQLFLIFKVAIPAAMPSVFTGIYTATGISFATLVVSEMIGAKAGLGWYINWAKGWSNYAKVYASIIIMAVVFSIVMAVIFAIRDRVLTWQKGLLQ